jgi:8-oxo-dGTP pyrophosphatase MutT (NUDIX family)
MSIPNSTLALPPNLAPFTASLKTFHHSLDDNCKTRIVVGSFIFSNSYNAPSATPEPHLLILHRASADTFGDCWDFPGGCVELTDVTLLDAVKREVFEETGLVVSDVEECVGMRKWEHVRGGRETEEWVKFGFVVRVERSEETGAENGNGSDVLQIKLAEMEHQAFMWATEKDLLRSLSEEEGVLKFIARGEVEMALEAFRLFKARL